MNEGREIEVGVRLTHIWTLKTSFPHFIDLILKSTPMVAMKDVVKKSSAQRSKNDDFPTPAPPVKIRRTAKGASAYL